MKLISKFSEGGPQYKLRKETGNNITFEYVYPENQSHLFREFPMRVITKNPETLQNDTTYHSNWHQYSRVFRNLDVNPKYRQSEVFKESQEWYKQAFNNNYNKWIQQQESQEELPKKKKLFRK